MLYLMTVTAIVAILAISFASVFANNKSQLMVDISEKITTVANKDNINDNNNVFNPSSNDVNNSDQNNSFETNNNNLNNSNQNEFNQFPGGINQYNQDNNQDYKNIVDTYFSTEASIHEAMIHKVGTLTPEAIRSM